MIEHPQDKAIYFSRYDKGSFLATCSDHGFELEDQYWPSAEHYFQAHKFNDAAYAEKIRTAASPNLAKKLGRKQRKKLRKDWPQIKQTIMTRGIYRKFISNSALAQELLATGDQSIVESSNYDYYWGCGRDRRGHNHLGKILMRVRDKIKEQSSTRASQ